MPPTNMMFLNAGLGLEVIYSFVIVFCAFLVYFSTKRFYELSSHKGIGYFRLSFLFFGLAYLFRFFIKFLMVNVNYKVLFGLPFVFWDVISMFFYLLFSSIAIFFLLFSVISKNLKNKLLPEGFFVIFAILFSLITIVTQNIFVYILINTFLVVFSFVLMYLQGKSKKGMKNYVIYFLLSIFWLFNVLDILLPNFFRATQILIYLVSLSIFLLISYKVVRNLGP